MRDELRDGGTRCASGPPTQDWRAWLAGGTPRQVLARIVQGDPLQVRARVAHRLREKALLFDADRVHLRALARCARAAPSYRGRPDLAAWLDARVDEALADLRREDVERASQGDGEPEPQGALLELSRPLGLDARGLARACRAFNRLPSEDRHAFFQLVLEGRSIDELVRAASPETDATTLARRARRALCALLACLEPPRGPDGASRRAAEAGDRTHGTDPGTATSTE